ncbi:hypothetical protein M404DRAFT_837487 [Pisolithus tinctorius Marx 270]|uniref:Secreted protein n=1 Tax=Pisolithus tinctorius Marx 270 TaxID=870435 RepID=A0A0C3KNN8_PISTI|nr:hypothetical protein M404DRAFT_837487 [Pisolithus tinctorius Marx 270]
MRPLPGLVDLFWRIMVCGWRCPGAMNTTSIGILQTANSEAPTFGHRLRILEGCQPWTSLHQHECLCVSFLLVELRCVNSTSVLRPEEELLKVRLKVDSKTLCVGQGLWLIMM